ncbi:hypothetical protein [Pseudomonas sp.]|uniref:hypothetical protein n=1 Tax=Pseudomonas sp. TaxID=306 RepID=UPI00273723C1|nr:hypothetical protein [Pseudomonas sp.]MDP3815315.1 hypothetical protein [Pseudomonas sp.]
MKLEIARGLFLVAALSVASIAAAAWHEPGTQVISQSEQGASPASAQVRTESSARPDHDLLLFIFSLSQGVGPKG